MSMMVYACVAAGQIVAISETHEEVVDFSKHFYFWNDRRTKVRSVKIDNRSMFYLFNEGLIVDDVIRNVPIIANESKLVAEMNNDMLIAITIRGKLTSTLIYYNIPNSIINEIIDVVDELILQIENQIIDTIMKYRKAITRGDGY